MRAAHGTGAARSARRFPDRTGRRYLKKKHPAARTTGCLLTPELLAAYLLLPEPLLPPLGLGAELEPLLPPVLLPVLPAPDVPAPPAEPALPLELGVDVLGEAEVPPPDALEPAFAAKCLSHSAREIWPSPFASTVVKLGCALEELEAPPLDALSDAPLEEPPDDALPGELALGALELPPELALEPELLDASELLDPVALGVLEAPEAPDVEL